mmetsp:Transcript_146170/g.468831  ORF Transcript_146170/g.468831 Transcript_146170/m.468831 type:complete len:208 (+) Transcript_146170:110-733(+)
MMDLESLIEEVRNGVSCEASEWPSDVGLVAAPCGWGTSWPPRAVEALASRSGQSQQLRDINRAQFDAMLKRLGGGAQQVSAATFYGNWTDSFGNVVCVYSTDAYKTNLVASLSKPPRADINLQIRPIGGGSGWLCGNAVLSYVAQDANELCWSFNSGETSTWSRRPDDATSLASFEPRNLGCTDQLVNGMWQEPIVTYVLMPYLASS